MRAVFIYFLKDPLDPKKGYIGKARNPASRLVTHLKCDIREKGRKRNWLLSLLRHGLPPELEILAQVPESNWQQEEKDHIAAFRSLGFDLVNSTDGGDGGPMLFGKDHPGFGKPGSMRGKKHTPEARAKIKAKRALQIITPEMRKRAGRPGVPKPAGFGEKMSIRLTGILRSPKARAGLRIKRSGATSKFHGVYLKTENGKWQARIGVSPLRITLGYFSNEIEAAQAYDVAAKKYHGEFAKLNFP